jgi:hypothetical protein
MLNELARSVSSDTILPDRSRAACDEEQSPTMTRVPMLDWPSDLYSRPDTDDAGSYAYGIEHRVSRLHRSSCWTTGLADAAD